MELRKSRLSGILQLSFVEHSDLRNAHHLETPLSLASRGAAQQLDCRQADLRGRGLLTKKARLIKQRG